MEFLGQDGFQWGLGVIEDRFDPEKLGRVRVRWLGLHNEAKEKILTKDLPWSTVMQPVSASSMAGVGDSPTNLVEGTWVVGFAKDDSFFEWIVMGTLPGMNTTTAFAGKLQRKWAKQRGTLQDYTKEYSSDIPDASEKYLDYEFGFHDPTVDQRNIPYPPSDVTIGHSQKFGDYSAGPGKHYPELHENSIAKPQSYYVNSPGTKCGVTKSKSEMIPESFPDDKFEKTPRVPNYKPAGKAPNDLDACDDEKWDATLPELKGYAPKFVRLTHSDVLHYLYRTTRRVTADMRQCEAWTHFGSFMWPDVSTYGVREHVGVNLSTGYLEDGHWRADKSAGSPGGTHAPTWPITRDTPTSSTDSAGLAGIEPLDNRASWGKDSGQEIGYFLLDGEQFRLTHPRTPYVQKGKLGPTQRQLVKDLFDAGHYGTGIYNVSDPKGPETRKDILFKEVKETDLVVLPEKDTNRLAEGGIPISSISGNKVKTKSSLFGSPDTTKYFSTSNESKNKNTKPVIKAGDVIMISGARGAEEYNGRVYRVLTVVGGFTIKLGTMDGLPWSGPGSIKYSDLDSATPSTIDAVELSKDYTNEYSAYLGGGVITVNPHWMVRAKAETRERQINIGNPEMNTGINFRFWNQPTSRWAAQYPFNHVYESESGHIKEYDDTPGAERIHEYHRSGTYYEIDHQGTKVDYVKGDNYNVRIFDDYLYVKGKVAWTMDDAVWIRCNDRLDLSAKWKIQIHSGGDLDLSSKRNINMKAAGDINMQYDGNMNILGTALDPVSSEFHAGTRPCDVLSFLTVKTGHIQQQAIEDVKIQADLNIISLKTLTDTIYISSGEDIETFAFGDSFTETMGRIYEFSIGENNRTAMVGSINDVSEGTGVHHYSLAGDITMESLTGHIKFNANAGRIRASALASTIELFAAGDIKVTSFDGDMEIKSAGYIDVTAIGDMNLGSKAGEFKAGAHAGKVQIRAEAGDLNLYTSLDMNIEAKDTMRLESVEQSINIKSFISTLIDSGLNFHNNAGTEIRETATTINMNGPAANIADGADTAAVFRLSAYAVPMAPGFVVPALPAFMAATIDIPPIDIPDPAPGDGVGLAINANDPGTPGSGYGGENIRATHDTINDIIAGNSNTTW